MRDAETVAMLQSIGDGPVSRKNHPPSISDRESDPEANKGRIQWSVLPAGTYAPYGETTKTLPPDIYKAIHVEQHGTCLRKLELLSDELIDLPDSANLSVLTDIQYFWESEERFKEYGQLFKRGVLLFGPAGSGKTSTMILVARDIVRRGGIVLVHWGHPDTTSEALQMIRAIEAKRPIVCIFEDIEEVAKLYGDSGLLSILDGEHQVGNVVNVATTNFPQELGARFLKRPGRFDEIIRIGMPSAEMRRSYLENLVGETDGVDIEKWVRHTENMSLAFLRELVVGVCCLKKPYDVVMEKLKIMTVKPKAVMEYENKGVGFATPASNV